MTEKRKLSRDRLLHPGDLAQGCTTLAMSMLPGCVVVTPAVFVHKSAYPHLMMFWRCELELVCIELKDDRCEVLRQEFMKQMALNNFTVHQIRTVDDFARICKDLRQRVELRLGVSLSPAARVATREGNYTPDHRILSDGRSVISTV